MWMSVVARRCRLCTGRNTKSSAQPGYLRSAFLAINQAQCCLEPSRQFLRVIIRPEVHEIKPRLLIHHVTVKSRHLDAVVTQGFEHRAYFSSNENEITSDCRFA